MTSTISTIIKLRWTLTWATLRKSVWQTVGYCFSLLLAVGMVVAAALVGWNMGSWSYADGSVYGMPVNRWLTLLGGLVVVGGSFATLIVCLVQIMFIGEGSTLNARRFALYGIPDRELQSGLLAAGLSGTPAISGLLALLLWSCAYRPLGAGVMVVALISAPLTIVTMISLSKMLIALVTNLVRSQRAKNLFYVITILVVVIVGQIPNILFRSGGASGFDADAYVGAASVLSWTPLGAGFQLPFDAAGGAWWAALLRVAILAATWVVCFMVGTWCLRRERLMVGTGGSAGVAKGVGAFRWVADSRSGAISARLITYLKHDPRQSVMLLMPIIFVVLFVLQARGESAVMWQSLIWSGWFLNTGASNGLAYDGRGFAMQVISGVSGRDDRLSRARVFGIMEVAYMLVLGLVLFVVSGDWRTFAGIVQGWVFTALGIAMALVSLGVAQFTSCTLMYPVASLDKPFSSPQGRAMAQGFIPFLYMLGSLVLAVPTGVLAVILAVTNALPQFLWVLGVVGLINGLAVLVLGTLVGGRIMDRRLLKIVHTLDNFAALQK